MKNSLAVLRNLAVPPYFCAVAMIDARPMPHWPEEDNVSAFVEWYIPS